MRVRDVEGSGMRNSRRRALAARAAIAAVALATLASCSQISQPLPHSRTITAAQETQETEPEESAPRGFVVWADTFAPITPDFDPFSVTSLPGTRGGIVESLFVFNRGEATPPVPMLGTAAEFNDAGTELTISLRSGVHWSDGEALTPADVVFSYLHEPGRLSYLTDARVVDGETVLLVFSGPQFAQRAEILQRPIIAEHVAAQDLDEADADPGVDAAAAKTDAAPDAAPAPNDDVADFTRPLGTGPFTLGEVTDTSYTLVANPSYWRGGEPALPEVRFIAVQNYTEAKELLITNEADWVGLFFPDAQRIESYGYFSVADVRQEPLVVYTCANVDLGCQGPQTDTAVRQALDAAIDREELSEKVFAGYAHAPNPAFTLLGEADPWLADPELARSPSAADPKRASEILVGAGYTRGESDFFEKDGEQLQLRLASVEDWTDHNTVAELISEQAERAGIEIALETLPWEEFAAARQSGEFELIIGGMMVSLDADPLQIYTKWFGGRATTAVGGELLQGTWNVARYSNEEVNEAILAAAATENAEEKLAAYSTIQAKIASDLPYIPLLITPGMSFYNSFEYQGWPTQSDPYAFAMPWGTFSVGLVLSSLTPTR